MRMKPSRHERKRRAIQRARDRNRAAVFWQEKFLRSPRITAQGRTVEWPGEKVAPYREVLDRALSRDEIREHLSAMMSAFKKAMGDPHGLLIGTIRTDYDPKKKAYEWTLSGENTNPDDPGQTYVRIADPGRRS